jgi:hypothetical protein
VLQGQPRHAPGFRVDNPVFFHPILLVEVALLDAVPTVSPSYGFGTPLAAATWALTQA